MTQFQINKAYTALMNLSELRLPVKKARDLYQLTKKVEEYIQFAIQEESKYMDEFGVKRNQDGTCSFESQETFRAFSEKMTELNELNVDWDPTPIVLTDHDIGDQVLSTADILRLEGFVSFE